MPQVLKIYDGGVQNQGGHTVGVIIFDIVTGEGKPEKLIGYCRPNYRDAVIKNLKRLVWKEIQGQTVHLRRPESKPKLTIPTAAVMQRPAAPVANNGLIDVQQHGFWFVVRAWSADMKSWLIHHLPQRVRPVGAGRKC